VVGTDSVKQASITVDYVTHNNALTAHQQQNMLRTTGLPHVGKNGTINTEFRMETENSVSL
jgi:hypothetical protein